RVGRVHDTAEQGDAHPRAQLVRGLAYGGRPANLPLHAFAVGAAALPPGTIVLPATRELSATAAPHAQQAQHAPHAAEQPVPDPRPHIHALATGGRHQEAATLAQAWEQHVLQTRGHTSPEATHWAEIRADLARMAGNYGSATRLWINAGHTRLERQPPDDPEVLAAAAGALYCWTQLKDQAAARDSGPELVRLLRALPSLEPRLLKLTQQRLEVLEGAVGTR
ncbi:hypothetical protein AB0D97_35720, partial [Streptomyces roseus]